MKRLKSIFMATVFASSTLSPSLTVAHPDFEELETHHPTFFTGFKSTDIDLANQIRGRSDLATIPELQAILQGYSDKLGEHYTGTHGATFTKIKKEIDNTLANHPEEFTPLKCLYYCLQMILAQGRGTAEEQDFFTAAGFSYPYNLIKDREEPFSSWAEFLALCDEFEDEEVDDRGNFRYTTYQTFFDREEKVEEILEKGPFHSQLYLLPGESVLGLFYLAYTYYKGIHPVPVALETENAELHGIHMGPWAEFCHDAGHSTGDAADHSVEQFANNLLNLYARQLSEKASELSLPQKRAYSIKAMIPHMTNFALSVHNAYRQSLVDILELSLEGVYPQAPLSPGLRAFWTAAFVHAHEEPVDLSAQYGTSHLATLLKASIKSDESKEEGSAPTVGQPQEDEDLFQTSYVTGESPLNDKEIFNIVKERKLGEFLQDHYMYYGTADTTINESQISNYQVIRSPFTIQVEIQMLSGEDHIFRKETNHSKCLNFHHDRTILEAAEEVLDHDYGYALPPIPDSARFVGNPEGYKVEATACSKALDLGRTHLRDIFLKEATRLSKGVKKDETLSIADRFQREYKEAFRTLERAMPSFLSGQLDTFIDKATAFGRRSVTTASHSEGVNAIPTLTNVQAQHYLEMYPDLQRASASKANPLEWAKTHYRRHGHGEGRIFDLTDTQAQHYLDRYVDLQRASESKTYPLEWAKSHYRKHGRSEKRIYDLTHAEAIQYLANYPDLQAAAEKQPKEKRLNWARKHYHRHGKGEGRTYQTK